MSMRTCTLRPLRRCPSRARAPSFAAASTAFVPLRPAGRCCARRISSASGSPRAGQAHAAFTTPSWTRGASCTGRLHLRGLRRGLGH
eukprot:10621652-Alexandrium_andersonii.AAC.1